MTNRILIILAVALICLGGCEKDETPASTVIPASIPFIGDLFADPSYVFGVGSGKVYKTIPDTIGIVVDTIVGFEGGFGGKTKKDSVYLLKKDMTGSWPDTTKSGGFSISFQKLNSLGYKAVHSVNIVLAAPIANPGPTDFSGKYKRTSNNYEIDIVKVFNGVYVIDNPGGAGVALNPYLLYNYKNAAGMDSLAFPIQTNPCGGGLKLVSSSAPVELSAATYDKDYPPTIAGLSPITLSWKVFEFSSTSSSAKSVNGGLCQWGSGARTFVKQ